MQLLTILTEAVLEDILIDEIMALGAKGYTISDVRGRGTHGLRSGKWTASGNIRIEVVGDETLCARIVERLQAQYERDYGLLMFTSRVDLQN
ncbi:MAG: P-II family nitrogen regulator [Thiobacillaceae bacterium]